MRILIVDDDPDFRTFTTIALKESGIEFEVAENASEGLRILDEASPGRFDLILLDVEMPGPKGWDLLMQVRESGNETPVIFVTGLGRTEHRVRGLRLGADDYLTKPVEYEELLARIEAVLRRRHSLQPLEYGGLTLDLAMRRAYRDEKPVALAPREFDLAYVLASAGGAVVSRQTLAREVWEMDYDPESNILDVYIGRLRSKLDRHGRPMIQTVRGQGYRLLRDEDPRS